MAPGLQRQEPGRSGPSDVYHIVLVTFLVTVTKDLSRKQIRGRRISLGLLRGSSPSWLSRHGRVHGVILCDKTPLQSRKQRAKARMGQPILNKAHSPNDPLPAARLQSSTISPVSTMPWGPRIQTHEPVEDISHL